jgi:ribonuclease P protein component
VHRIKGKQFGFSKNYRLTSKKDINRLFQEGLFKSSGFLKFRYLSQSRGQVRVVISISKRVGKAPVRNRLKRLLRESLRTSGYLQNWSLDCAIYITRPLQRPPTLEHIQRYLSRFFVSLPDEYKKQDQQDNL